MPILNSPSSSSGEKAGIGDCRPDLYVMIIWMILVKICSSLRPMLIIFERKEEVEEKNK